MGTQLPPKEAQPPIFRPCLLWPNGWMEQDALGTEVNLGPGGVVLDRVPLKGAQPPVFGPCLMWPNGWMDDTPLGTEVDLDPGYIVLDAGPTSIPQNGHSSPPSSFRSISIVAMVVHPSYC